MVLVMMFCLVLCVYQVLMIVELVVLVQVVVMVEVESVDFIMFKCFDVVFYDVVCIMVLDVLVGLCQVILDELEGNFVSKWKSIESLFGWFNVVVVKVCQGMFKLIVVYIVVQICEVVWCQVEWQQVVQLSVEF